eukprot:g4192.t1
MSTGVFRIADDIESLTKLLENARSVRQERVEKILRPGLYGHERNAPSLVELTRELKNAINTIEAGSLNSIQEQYQNRPQRRHCLTLRTGLNRVTPVFKPTQLVFDRENFASISVTFDDDDDDPSMRCRDSNLTQWTAIEGVPEHWMDFIKYRQSSEFRFTPIEGVLERLMIQTSSLICDRSLEKKLSLFTDIEGIPEKNCGVLCAQEQEIQSMKNGTPAINNEKIGSTNGGSRDSLNSNDHDGHTGESCYQRIYQDKDHSEEGTIKLLTSTTHTSVNQMENPESVMKTYSQEFTIPQIEIATTPEVNQTRTSLSVVSISDQDCENLQDCVSVDGNRTRSPIAKHLDNPEEEDHAEQNRRSSLLGSAIAGSFAFIFSSI